TINVETKISVGENESAPEEDLLGDARRSAGAKSLSSVRSRGIELSLMDRLARCATSINAVRCKAKVRRLPRYHPCNGAKLSEFIHALCTTTLLSNPQLHPKPRFNNPY